MAEATMKERHLRPIRERTRLSELEAWDHLFGSCIQCGKIGQIEKSALFIRYGADVMPQDIPAGLYAGHAGRGAATNLARAISRVTYHACARWLIGYRAPISTDQ
ncbi:hypothetical protein [Phyllobacterium sp. CL33Tsu]|uniref:hypothetical protein n=1 Tax=Phyllobacterium sp. CL33Tsu TaxID=1798191 RepID=UPI001113A30B|nr:hypothetical protein [Phyllobacterium sp. CL33Tsu]